MSYQQLLNAIRRTDLGDDLCDFWVPVAAITTNYEVGVFDTFRDGEEDGGDEVLGVVGLLEDLDLLAEAGAIWSLAHHQGVVLLYCKNKCAQLTFLASGPGKA